MSTLLPDLLFLAGNPSTSGSQLPFEDIDIMISA